MTDEEIEERLRNEAIRLAKPFLNREVPPRVTSTYSDSGFEILWDEGYLPASTHLLDEGISAPQIAIQLAKTKTLFGIVEPQDLISFPATLHDELVADLKAQIATEPPLTKQRLDERLVKEISEFRVEMWSNESQHAGRPHVRVHLKGGAISVSLDAEPENLTPRGGLIGEASALKAIKKHRTTLLNLWNATRPDTQRLEVSTRASGPAATTQKGKRRSKGQKRNAKTT